MNIILIPILQVISFILTLYTYVLISYVAMNLLLNFQVINPGNHLVSTLMDFLYRAVEPVLSRIKNIVPFVGPFDLSPLILLLAIYLGQSILTRIILNLI